MALVGLFFAHAEVAQVRTPVLVAPSDVDVVLRAVQRRERPDVAVVKERGALNAFEL